MTRTARQPQNRISPGWHPLMILFGGQVHGNWGGIACRRQVVVTLRRSKIAGLYASEVHNQLLQNEAGINHPEFQSVIPGVLAEMC